MLVLTAEIWNVNTGPVSCRIFQAVPAKTASANKKTGIEKRETCGNILVLLLCCFYFRENVLWSACFWKWPLSDVTKGSTLNLLPGDHFHKRPRVAGIQWVSCRSISVLYWWLISPHGFDRARVHPWPTARWDATATWMHSVHPRPDTRSHAHSQRSHFVSYEVRKTAGSDKVNSKWINE